MSQVVRIPTNLYERLGMHAKGFDTPANVIEKLLNFYEEQEGTETTAISGTACEESSSLKEVPTSLKITYYPSDERSFKQLLLQTKKAYLLLHKVDGTTEFKEWNATNFDSSSDVNGNLRSGYLRGWKNKGIYKAEISTDQNDLT